MYETKFYTFGKMGYQAVGLEKIGQISKNCKNRVPTC
jgi:hypothetical protein